MGQAKKELIESWERGYKDFTGGTLCEYDVENKYIKDYINKNGTVMTCSYCLTKEKCISGDELLKLVMDAIKIKYEEAVNIMAVEKGEYIGADTLSTYDVLLELNDEMQLEPLLFEDVLGSVNDTIWCKINPYGIDEDEENSYLWYSFCEDVKYRSRYVFFRKKTGKYSWDKEPYEILDYIGEIVIDLDLIKVLPPKTIFYRGRMHDKDESVETDSALGSPPVQFAKVNRMSAEGISFFYGADNLDTALCEIYDDRFSHVTIGRFENKEEIYYLDLTYIKNMSIPDIFDVERRDHTSAILFLKSWINDLLKPIDKMQAIEYIPSQIIAEYFRYVFNYKDKDIKGIKYNSSKDNKGSCYALFYNNEECIENDDEKEKCKLKLHKSSIIHKKISKIEE